MFCYKNKDKFEFSNSISEWNYKGSFDKIAYIPLPYNDKIILLNFLFTTSRVPSKVNIAIAIDTSSSMDNEWNAMCEFLPELEQRIKSEFANSYIQIYS